MMVGARTILITAPTEDVVSLADMKKHLRVDHNDDDALIESYTAAVVDQIDAAGGGWLGRALRPQTWELRLPGFPYSCSSNPLGAIELPYPPFTSVESVKYDDTNGVEQTLAEGMGFRVIGLADDAPPPLHKISVAPLFNSYWPTARADVDTVRIRFVAGYEPAVAGDDPHDDYLPPRVDAWVKLVVGSLYENRESVVVNRIGQTVIPALPDHILAMLSTLRVY